MTQSGTVALLTEPLAYGMGIQAGIMRHARSHAGWNFRLIEWRGKATAELDLSGCIGFIGLVRTKAILDQVLAARLPAVNVAGEWPTPQIPTVTADPQAMGALAAEHLLEQGYRNAALWDGAVTGFSGAFRQGFTQAFTAGGGESIATQLPEGADFAEIMDRCSAWLRTLPTPVGIFTHCDRAAIQVANACDLAGLRVPGEAGIIGLGDDVHICRLCDPELSSVQTNAIRIGTEAALLLEQLLAGDPRPESPVLIPPAGITQRDSTRGPSIVDPLVALAMERVRNPRGKHISVESLLLDLRVSRRTLERSFQRELGMGPSEAIRRHRIRLAKTMLADQDLPIKDIALRTGFANPSQFSVAFHAATGMTPGEYRLNLCA